MLWAVKTVKRDWCVSIRLLLVKCTLSIVSQISRFVYCLSVLLLSISVVCKVQVAVGNGSVVFVLS